MSDAKSYPLEKCPVSGHEYRAPQPGDSRSVCPALNAMANHGYMSVFNVSCSPIYVCLSACTDRVTERILPSQQSYPASKHATDSLPDSLLSSPLVDSFGSASCSLSTSMISVGTAGSNTTRRSSTQILPKERSTHLPRYTKTGWKKSSVMSNPAL